ncbi:MAG: FAD-dependent oxidoreductase [Comamonadaceae bacterium]|nr:MAG: FAD-dependent oxidoreductase [Comamonadaceae bacterium]
MHVCVLGAGIAGLSTAYLLQQAGHAVTVVDASGPAAGASGGNGGQLSYSYVQPLADAGIWAQLPRLLLSPDSPLKIRPQLDPRQWAWGLRFLRACNAGQSASTTRALLALAAHSRDAFDAMREREQLDCDFSATGKLVLFRSEAGFVAARRQLALQQELGGARQLAVTAAEALAIEPALAGAGETLAGAIYTPSECAADCQQACTGLAALLQQRGAQLRFGTAATGFLRHGRRIAAVHTSAGEFAADAFVLALGTASAALARPLGLRLPLYPLKGYSITLELEDDAGAPRVSITDSARKLVFARIGRRLRVAGMAELVGHDASIPPARIETLESATRALFPQCRTSPGSAPWTGMRPATPTGLPIVGRHPRGPENLLLNTGHGALGFTLAFGTAQQVVAALAPARPHPVLRPAPAAPHG